MTLPSGTVTFLFTDVEGSTRLLHELGAAPYAEALAEHRRVIREGCARSGGVEVDTQGDAFFFAFPTAPGALSAAGEITEALASGPIQVRIGLHTGTPLLTEEGYVGGDVHRAARIAAAGHGGQVLVSSSTIALVPSDKVSQGLGLRDLGEHRLKDLSAPERIFQLGNGDFPALKSLYRTNLPVPATAFLGRESELAEVLSLLSSDDTRLLTLTGPGGTGKTRLALQAAAEAADAFPDGIWWVPLAPLRDPKLVLETAAQAVGSNNGLAEHVSDKEMLCLFDNFEQVVEAGAELAELLAACPNLEVLVTSREPLHVTGEQEYAVPPLVHAEGVGFFLARARGVRPNFIPDEAVSEICQRLDELPLALELAAARVKALSTVQILERLEQRLTLLTGGARDLPKRQRTLRATIEWSHELLTPEEQRLFARLAVFRGGSTLEAAEKVAAADLDVLQSLVDKSLVRHTGERYWMLETIREYATERLGESNEADELRRRHAEHFLALAEQAYENRRVAESVWFPIMDAERDNMRAALDWAAAGDPQFEAQLAGSVAHHWTLQGYVPETHDRLARAVARYQSRDRIRARTLTHLGSLGWIVTEREALSALQEALGIWREQGDALGEALALETIGHASSDVRAARLAFEQSLAVRREAGAPDLEGAGSLAGLCQLLVSSGEVARVEPAARELYELGERCGSRDTQGDALHYLADCPLIAGDYAEAEVRYARALGFARGSGIPSQCANELLGVAMSTAGQGNHARAVRLAAAAYAKKEALGLPRGKPGHFWTRLQEWFIGGARAQLTPEELEAAERAGEEVPFDAVLDEVLGAETAPAAS